MKLTKVTIERLATTGKRYSQFDTDLTGFAVRVGADGDKAFYYVYRAGKGRSAPLKWLRLGSFPTMTVEQARQLAKEKAAAVTLGADPAREVREDKAALFVRDALASFQEEHISKLKPSSVQSYTAIIERHLLPKTGNIRVKDAVYADIAKLHHGMKKTPYLANRTLAVLSKFFAWCELHGYREQNSNPCRGITKYTEHKRQQFMSTEELAVLGETLFRMEKAWIERQYTGKRPPGGAGSTITSQAAAVIRLLMFTGARVGEILSLEWKHVNLEQGVAVLPDSKTGFKVLQLPAPALAILKKLPQTSLWVFPGDSASGHMVNIADAWGDVLKQAGLSGWRIHDLRHAFASVMVNGGASLPIVGKILGHTQASTTQRYAHLEENPARKAAEDAAARIVTAMTNKNAVLVGKKDEK